MLRNWAGNVAFSTSVLHSPASVDELQELVAASPRVRALGTGHSFSRVADSSGALVTLAGLPFEPTLGPDTVTVPAGATYGAIAAFLEAHGRALPNLGSLPHISVAGACATGTHGSGDAHRCLAASAVGVTFVAADGSLVSVAASDEAFGGSVLALGALGIVVSLTLATVPSFTVRQDVWLDAPLSSVLPELDDVLAGGYSVSLFTTLARPVIDRLWIKSVGPPVDASRWGGRPAAAAVHPADDQDASAATVQLGVPGPWHERLPHFRLEFTPSSGDEQQSEYLIPRPVAADAISALYSTASATPVVAAALQVMEVRSVAADPLWLSPCGARATVALHFTWAPSDDVVGPAVRAVEAALAPFDPRPHWGKVFALPADLVRSAYPRLADFQALAARYDPERTFTNAFLERYVY